MRRIVLLVVLALAFPAGAGAAPRDPLTADEFNAAIAPVALRVHRQPVAAAAGQRISVAVFDRLVVKQVGLIDLARSVQAEATRAGLAPPSRFGTEVVARALGLRWNHPTGDDASELFPSDSITHAEVDYSFARLRTKSSGSYAYVRGLYEQFALPAYTPAEQRALHVAVSRIGYPYIGAARATPPRAGTARRRTAATTARASSGASSSSRATRPAPPSRGARRRRWAPRSRARSASPTPPSAPPTSSSSARRSTTSASR